MGAYMGGRARRHRGAEFIDGWAAAVNATWQSTRRHVDKNSMASSLARGDTDGVIAAGDLVIVLEDFKRMHAVRVSPGQTFHNRFGSFPHDAMVGCRFGYRMRARGGDGFVHLLAPTPELWTSAVSHRTQILYVADISMITLGLDVGPGKIVVEAGTGSGSLSHAIARSVGRTGKLHTYEFHEQRAGLAAAEFAANGLSGIVESRHADVCEALFTYDGAIAPRSVDAAIFDLPQPWLAVPNIAPFMRPGGRLCCFSPCIEQVGERVGPHLARISRVSRAHLAGEPNARSSPALRVHSA